MKSLLLRLSFVVIVILLFLQLIKNFQVGDGLTITAPRNKSIPVKGEWMVEKYKTAGAHSEEQNSLEDWIGKKVYFSEDIAVLGEETCSPPSYKVRTLELGNYLLNNYNIPVSDLGVENHQVSVISVTSKEKHFYDFIHLDENQLIVHAENAFLFLKKVSENIYSSDVAEKVKNNKLEQKAEQVKEEGLYRSGVLLGLKSAPAPENNNRPSYRTLWIATKNRTLYPVKETAGLLVPRMSGFWKVELKAQYKNNFLQESLITYPLESTSLRANVFRGEEQREATANILKNILYIGNDYISFEYGEGTDLATLSFDRLQVVPIDKPEVRKIVKISDIEGDLGKNALDSSAKAHLTSNQSLKSEALEKEPREDNFAVVRRNGHWIMKGRLDYLNPLEGKKYEDFTINLMPSKKIVNYDELSVSWNAIKERVPEALDAYASPNRDVVIILCRNCIYVYGVENTKLAQKPLDRVKIKDGESVIMAEWATGEYVERWEKVFAQDSWLVQ